LKKLKANLRTTGEEKIIRRRAIMPIRGVLFFGVKAQQHCGRFILANQSWNQKDTQPAMQAGWILKGRENPL